MNAPSKFLGAVLLLALLTLPSCATGLVYTHVVVPLDRNVGGEVLETEDGERPRDVSSDTRQVTISSVSVSWGENGIGAIAKQHGIEEVYFADLEILTVFGVWRQSWVHIYGR